MLPVPSTKEISELYYQLSQALSDSGIPSGKLLEARSVAGGDINLALHLKTDARDLFLKLNDECQLAAFIAELKGLEAIAATETLRCPVPLAHGVWRGFSYLLLEFLPMQHQGDWSSAGKRLAQLHKRDAGTNYGFDIDTYCGPSLQPNDWQHNWADFFVKQRIRPQLLQLARHCPLEIDRHCGNVNIILNQHQPQPALLHGDLWSGNISFCHSSAVVYDPAVYIGDRETDLAMTQLFGNFPEAFYMGYNQHYAIDENYVQRRPVYQLYHLLNHANLFGNSYYQQVEHCLTAIDRNT